MISRKTPDIDIKLPETRVAAYCRVSKKIELQATSLETQMATYRKIISEHPGWKLAGIYADRGISGTCKANRTEFMRLLADCDAGKIDKILVKSVSRMARNTVDMLETVRDLREKGISIYFEKEKVDTMSLTSELLLSIYAAFAQNESFSLSENMKSGVRKRFSMGQPKWTRIYGFRNVTRNEWEIDEAEAKVVRKIFESYYEGDSLEEISAELNRKQIPAPIAETWYPCAVSGILHNEKYVGDYLMQKTYVVDHLNHKRVKNDKAEVQQFYKKNDHDPIVERDIYEDVQKVIYMRGSKRGIKQYPYYGFLRCPYCGAPMVRFQISRSRGFSWVCSGQGNAEIQAERSSCKPFIVMERYLDIPVLDAIEHLDEESLPLTMQRDYRKIRKLMTKKNNVEYYYLKALVEKITFTDWNVMEITWKHGEKSLVQIEYDTPTDIPDPRELYVGKDLFINGMWVHPRARAMVKKYIRKKEEMLSKLRIIAPEPDAPVAIPIIEMIKEEENDNENNETAECAGAEE